MSGPIDPAKVAAEFQENFSERIKLKSEGVRKFRVVTPFQFPDGDHLRILLERRDDGGWTLTDEGHTLMHLSYQMDVDDLLEGTRKDVFGGILSTFGTRLDEGELQLPVPEGRYGDALYNFVQTILQITDIEFMSRERVRSTFLADLMALVTEVVPQERLVTDWHDPKFDTAETYTVDYRIVGVKAAPVFLFALPTEARMLHATINIRAFESWGLEFRPVGVFENQEDMNRKNLAKFTDVCQAQFAHLSGVEDRIRGFLKEQLLAG